MHNPPAFELDMKPDFWPVDGDRVLLIAVSSPHGTVTEPSATLNLQDAEGENVTASPIESVAVDGETTKARIEIPASVTLEAGQTYTGVLLVEAKVNGEVKKAPTAKIGREAAFLMDD